MGPAVGLPSRDPSSIILPYILNESALMKTFPGPLLLPEKNKKDPKLYTPKNSDTSYILPECRLNMYKSSFTSVCLTCNNAMLSVSSCCCYVFMHVCCMNFNNVWVWVYSQHSHCSTLGLFYTQHCLVVEIQLRHVFEIHLMCFVFGFVSLDRQKEPRVIDKSFGTMLLIHWTKIHCGMFTDNIYFISQWSSNSKHT